MVDSLKLNIRVYKIKSVGVQMFRVFMASLFIHYYDCLKFLDTLSLSVIILKLERSY